MSKIETLSLVMPTYNEAGNIQELIRQSAQALTSTVKHFELIVVDDDSPDKTWELAEAMKDEVPNLRVIRRNQAPGLTASIQTGIEAARFDVIGWMDCDFSHPPEKLSQLIYMINHGFDVAVNSRFVIGGGEERSGKGGALLMFLSLALNWSVRFALRSSFADYTSGFVIAQRRVLDAIQLRGDYGEYFIDFIYRAIRGGYRICELPYVAQPRRSGESKTGTTLLQFVKRGRKYLMTVLRLRMEDAAGKITKKSVSRSAEK